MNLSSSRRIFSVYVSVTVTSACWPKKVIISNYHKHIVALIRIQLQSLYSIIIM